MRSMASSPESPIDFRPQMATVVSMESPVDDCFPGVSLANEDNYDSSSNNDHYKLGACKIGKRTCWILGVVVAVIAAGAVLTTVALMTKNDAGNNNNSANGGRASVVQRSEAYYQERFSVFRPAAGKLSVPSDLVESDTPQSQALDWMVYSDMTIQHLQFDETQFAQRYAVLVLFYACGGEAWQGFQDGLDKQGDIPTCQWQGDNFLACNEENEIVELKMVLRRLIGRLPQEMKLLTSLQNLELSNNFIEGTIPDGMFDEMSDLQRLFLNMNELAGTIPSALGKITGLQSLDLGYNIMTGPLPLELQALTSLKIFAAKDNFLTGPFFEPFGEAWSTLERLDLDGTLFTGTIPDIVFAQWASSIVELSIGHTLFHGTLPTLLNNLSQLTSLYVVADSFGGQLPDFSKLGNLYQLALEGDLFTGTIPTTIGLLSNLDELGLRRMNITGTIPTELGNCSSLRRISIYESELTGTIPTEIGNLKKLEGLTIVNNFDMTGTIPNTFCDRATFVSVIYNCDFACECCYNECVK